MPSSALQIAKKVPGEGTSREEARNLKIQAEREWDEAKQRFGDDLID